MISNLSEDAKIYFEIKKKYVTVTPENVVKEAKKPGHPWHNRFDWDVDRAAQQHWENVARNIISKIEVTVVTTERSYTVNLAVRDPRKDSTEQGYTDIIELSHQPLDARLAIIKELQMSRSYLERARAYALTLGQEEEIERFINSLTELSNRYEKKVKAKTAKA